MSRVDLDIEQLDFALLVGSGVLLLAILAVRLSVLAGLPSLLFYLLLGVLLNIPTRGGLDLDSSRAAHALAFVALIVILTEGGITTQWSELRPAIRTGATLATVGVTVSVGVMTLAGVYLLGFDWELAVLLAAVTAPTDAAAVFSVLRRVPLPRRVVGALEAESGLNDAPTVLLVTLASTGALNEHGGVVGLVGLVALELAGGALIGVGIGRAGVWGIRWAALPSSGLSALAALALCFAAYAVAAEAHTSGFAAVYAAALVVGNGELPHRVATRSFIEGVGWLAQIGLFVMLGLLLPLQAVSWSSLGLALVAGAVLTVLARPLSVAVTALCDRVPVPRLPRAREARLSMPEQAFVSWAGLRGAVPIVLATIPLSENVPGAAGLFVIVFVLVVIDTLVTAPTLPWVARRLGLAPPTPVRDLDVEAAPLDRIAADLLQVRVTDRSRIHGVEINELRLPRGASVALIVRNGEVTVPEPRTVLRRGDDLLVVTPRALRDPTEKRLRAVSQSGRLAGWLD